MRLFGGADALQVLDLGLGEAERGEVGGRELGEAFAVESLFEELEGEGAERRRGGLATVRLLQAEKEEEHTIAGYQHRSGPRPRSADSVAS